MGPFRQWRRSGRRADGQADALDATLLITKLPTLANVGNVAVAAV